MTRTNASNLYDPALCFFNLFFHRCIDLRPDWGKGYARKGAAEQALGRFDAAAATFSNGLRMEPSDAALSAALRGCKEAAERARLAALAAAKREREALEANSDDLLGGFFSDISNEAEKRAEEQREREAQARSERVQTEKTEAYTSQALGKSEEQVSRLTGANYVFKNLDPFRVLQLDIDATLEDIRYRYKKLSLLCHPDKNLDNLKAEEAFDELKKAYEVLLDEEKRALVVATIEGTRAATAKERRRLVNKGAKEKSEGGDLEPLELQQEKDVMKAFADIELKRRDSEKHLASSRKREREHEEEAKTKAAAVEEHDKTWAKETRVDDRIGDWRDFQGTKGGKKVDVKNFKQQERADSKKPKFGAADMESWKKAWK